MIVKWDELKKFVEFELAGLKGDSRKIKPEWEEYFDEGCTKTLTLILNRMENLEREVREKGGW